MFLLPMKKNSPKRPALRRLAGDQVTVEDLRALRIFVDLLEPVKDYKRGSQQPGATQFMPLDGLVDCARPDSAPSREFATALDQFLAAPPSPETAKLVVMILNDWRAAARHLLVRLPALSPRLAEARPLLQALVDAAESGTIAAAARRDGRSLTAVEAVAFAGAVKGASQAYAAVEMPASQSLAKLLNAPHTP